MFDDAAAPAAPAPRKRATRRSTRKQAAPEQAPEGVDSESTQAAEAAAAPAAAPEPDAPAGEKAAPAKPARKRATRKKAAAPAPAVPDTVTEILDQAEAAVAEILPGQTAAATEHAATEQAAPEAIEPRATDEDAQAQVDGATPADQAGTEPAEDESAEDDAADEQADDETGPVVQSFSVLFQAPDPEAATTAQRSRRRRAKPEPQPEQAEVPEPETEQPAAEETSEEDDSPRRARRRRGGKGRRGRNAEGEADDNASEGEEAPAAAATEQPAAEGEDGQSDESDEDHGTDEDEAGTSRRRRRRRRSGPNGEASSDEVGVTTRVRTPRSPSDEPTGVKGSTRLEAKKHRRREGREAGRRRTVITEAEFLARRESVERVMVVRNRNGRTQMGVLEDSVLVEHYIDQAGNVSMAGNIYLGRVQNVLPSMEAAFVDIGKGRNAVLYAGEVNWDAAGLDANQPKRIENALESGQTVLVQVTKDPIGHKGARLTSQISLPGRYLVYVPNSSMTGISRKLPDTERARLKKILRQVVPEHAGVIVRTAAEGASEEELRADVERLTRTWEDIQSRAEAASTPKAGKSKGRKKNGGSGSSTTGSAPMLLHGEPDLTVRVIRDVFNEDFKQLIVSGEQAWQEIHPYITAVAPDLADRVTKWTGNEDLFSHYRVDEQLAKAMDRKVWLPSGGSLVIDRTEAMTVIDVNTGKFVGSGGNLEETVTKNNIEAAEEIVRQLRLRDIGGIIVVDFIDMVLESNRDLVVRRLLECLGRDRTKHQVAEVTSLGLVQMTRKRVGSGLIEVFSETCDHCNGRGFIIHSDPVDKGAQQHDSGSSGRRGRRGSDAGNGNGSSGGNGGRAGKDAAPEAEQKQLGPTAAQIAAMAHAAAVKNARLDDDAAEGPDESGEAVPQDRPVEVVAEMESDEQKPAVSEPVTPEESAPQSSRRQEPEAAESTEEPSAEKLPAEEPAHRPRRRRGRVVAPAGPPGASHITHVDSPDGETGTDTSAAGGTETSSVTAAQESTPEGPPAGL
ncbi:MAG: Rne/Rng family ribonuclease [Intrasporangium sp.]|uniref:Rne/Rng family ribonuclease n=1 Tax=Intrasporangium sp. TaxID=1925024 RepID=UPI003F7FF8EA